MKTRAAITLGLSALALGGAVVGVQSSIAVASSRDQSRAEKHAASEAKVARKALAGGKVGVAVIHAEAAVRFQPQAATYRMLLGQSYLKAGRFASARDAFADTITLDGANGKAALNLALTEIATGDWAGARKTLDEHGSTIPVADRGLALALAGDPAAAVELLTGAARAPDADAKTRQNLALSLALAGRWQEAKTVVAIDVTPAEVDQRIMQWATFSRPKSASDQVAALIGVTPAADPGQPVALALNGAASLSVQAKTDAIDRYMPGTPAAASADAPVEAPVAVAVAATEPVVPVAAPVSGVVFGPRQEVVQPLPLQAAATTPVKRTAKVSLASVPRAVTAAPVRPAAKGGFYVQIGAYDNAGVARDAWSRAARRFSAFAPHIPQGMNVSSRAGSFYRLSVGGFARADAVSLCTAYRAKGGVCFVRAGAGDQVAMWAKSGREMASR